MKVFNFIVYQILSNNTIFLGLIALIGLLLQKKKFPQVIDGVVKTIIGLTILTAGSGILISSLSPVINKLNSTLKVKGVLPTNDAVFGVALQFNTLAKNTVITFLIAFLIHLVLVRISHKEVFKNVYLTAHLELFLAAFLNAAIPTVLKTNDFWTITLASIFAAVYYTYSPAIPRIIGKKWLNNVQTLGFMDQVGSILAHFIGKWFGNKHQDADNMKLPKWASMFRDNTITLFFLMPLIFLGIGLAVGQKGIESLSGTGISGTNWILWLILNGFKFTAGIVILLQGVRMFIGSIVPAFKGISDKFLPGAIPALDAPTFFPFSPMGGMFGFLGSTIGCILVTFLTIFFKSPIIVFPSPIIMYFDGNVMGVFGNKAGGWRGAIFSGFITGMISSAAVILFYPLTGPMFGSGLTFSNIDFALVWMPLMYLLKLLRSIFLMFV